MENLKNFAKRRTDIFGSGDVEAEIGRRVRLRSALCRTCNVASALSRPAPLLRPCSPSPCSCTLYQVNEEDAAPKDDDRITYDGVTPAADVRAMQKAKALEEQRKRMEQQQEAQRKAM